MPYTTLVAGTTITASWANANVRDQVVTPFASSAARTSAISAPVEGMLSVLTDTDLLDGYDGTAWQKISYIPGFQFARKTADESVTSSTTLQDDNHLVVAVVASAVYVLEMWVAYISASETPDLKFAFTLPASATASFSALGLFTSVTGSTAGSIEAGAQLAQTTPTASINVGAVNGNLGMVVRGLVITGASAGNVTFQWAQAVSNGTATTVKQDSWLMLRRVA